MKTLRELAADALQVQDACNLSGVVFGFSRAMDDLCKHAHEGGHGTDWKNQHPISILWADKIADLTGITRTVMPHNYAGAAHDACRELAEGA